LSDLHASGPAKPKLFSNPELYVPLFWVAVCLYLIAQATSAYGLLEGTFYVSGDNTMRLLSVRDLLNGQSWFDMTQHRVLPPEGLSLHWSRLVDAPIAGLELLFRQVLSPDRAELVTACVWPAILFVLFLALTGHVARARFGNSAAVFSLLAAAAVPSVSNLFFRAGEVDHHNVQMLMMLIVTAGLLLQGRPVAMGLAAGVAAAFSFAVGLEMILFIAAAGLILTAQFVLNAAEADRKLPAFGLGLGLAAPVFFAVQTNPALWLAPKCDALSPTFLAVSTVAGLFSLSLGFGGRRLGRSGRIGMALGLGAVALAALAPVLAPCRAGPYADLPAKVQALMNENIGEMQSVMTIFVTSPVTAIVFLLPIYVTLFCLIGLILSRNSNDAEKAQVRDLAVLLAFVTLGAVFAAVQIRTAIMGVAVLPLALGGIVDRLANRPWQRFNLLRGVVLILTLLTTFVPQFVAIPIISAQAARPAPIQNAAAGTKDSSCLPREQIQTLSQISPSIIATPLNLGSNVLYFTNHSVTSAAYHRSARAMYNGFGPFIGDETAMRDMIEQSSAAYVVVCKGETYGSPDSIGSRLARGDAPVWMVPVNLGQNVLLLAYDVRQIHP
jgi:hypothetical protein